MLFTGKLGDCVGAMLIWHLISCWPLEISEFIATSHAGGRRAEPSGTLVVHHLHLETGFADSVALCSMFPRVLATGQTKSCRLTLQ